MPRGARCDGRVHGRGRSCCGLSRQLRPRYACFLQAVVPADHAAGPRLAAGIEPPRGSPYHGHGAPEAARLFAGSTIGHGSSPSVAESRPAASLLAILGTAWSYRTHSAQAVTGITLQAMRDGSLHCRAHCARRKPQRKSACRLGTRCRERPARRRNRLCASFLRPPGQSLGLAIGLGT